MIGYHHFLEFASCFRNYFLPETKMQVGVAQPELISPSYPWEYLELSKRPWTTYGKMTEWMKTPRSRDIRSGLPATLSKENWKPAERTTKEDVNSRFRDSYSHLTQQIAYRFPNPGLPRLRQGRIGGTWRHVKEVLGHSGSRVCYIDGLVSVYDDDQFNKELHTQSPYRPHLRRLLYSTNREFDTEAIRQDRDGVSLPAVEELPMMSHNERIRKLALQSTNKHKGVYLCNQN